MDSSNKPVNITVRWAQNASGTYVRDIPTTTADPDEASYSLGFPPATFVPVSAGGTPPDGRDVNGILQRVTDWTRWTALGGPIAYDAALQTAVGGYPLGAIVASVTNPGWYYRSTTENNVTNPDALGAGWSPAFSGRSLTGNSVINSALENMVANTIKGRLSSLGSPQDLSGSQVTALLSTFTSVAKGLVPAGGGNPSLPLRADGTFGTLNLSQQDISFFTNANGYSFKVGVMHVQMGIASTINPDTSRTVTFPTAFSGAPQWYNVGGRRATYVVTQDFVMEVTGSPTSTNMVVTNNNVANNPVADATWMAVRFG